MGGGGGCEDMWVQVIERGVPGGLVGLRPLPVGWRCHSRRPAGGSTLPRRRCSRAGLRAGRQRRLLWPEVRLDLGSKTFQNNYYVFVTHHHRLVQHTQMQTFGSCKAIIYIFFYCL